MWWLKVKMKQNFMSGSVIEGIVRILDSNTICKSGVQGYSAINEVFPEKTSALYSPNKIADKNLNPADVRCQKS